MATIETSSPGEIGAAPRPQAVRRAPPRGLHFAGLISILAGLALWEFLSRLAVSGQLWPHISISAVEFAIGYVIASLLGIVVGFAMASSELGKKILQPWISGLYATPTIALAPLFILWLGIGIWSKVLVVIFLVLFPVTINTEAGLRTTSERLIEMLKSFGASRSQIFFKVSLPSALPFILAGLKLGIGRGLIGVVVAELFGSRAGLGRLISQSADAFN